VEWSHLAQDMVHETCGISLTAEQLLLNIIKISVGFEVLTAVVLKNSIF
jgi:hypothetical protein